jgi:hypothetical protein
MSEDTSASAEIGRYTFAMNDKEDVSGVARLIAEHDPNFNPFGPSVALPRGLHERQAAVLMRRAEDIYGALGNRHLRIVLETGLIVTYARPFTEGRGTGLPIPEERFVPADGRELHRKMLELRNKVQAHIDASAPEGFRRTVEHSEEPGSWSVRSSGPRYLGAEELRGIAELADQIIARLTTARDEARAAG